MVTENNNHRRIHALETGESFAKDGSLRDREPHVQTEDDKHSTQKKRNAPAESEELLIGEPGGQHEEHTAGEQEPDRSAELRDHAVPRPFPGRRLLNREEHRAAPFAPQTDALAQAATGEEQRRRNA